MDKPNVISLIGELQDVKGFREQYWEGSFGEYLNIIQRTPKVARSAYQRLYDMILSYGTEGYTRNRETIVHYRFFDDPFDDGCDAIYGLDKALAQLVQIFESAARRYGTEKRVLLLHGPVGSAKSTIVRLLKKGLEAFCKTDDGALYTLSWVDVPDVERLDCPMHDGRALQGLGLAFAMSNRGACHLQHTALPVESNWCAHPEAGLPGGYKRKSSEGKADMVFKSENLGMLLNACAVCQFNMYALSPGELTRMMNLATGFDYDVPELLECGERIWLLKRGLNNLMGVTAADDRLPPRMLTPFDEGGSAGLVPDMDLMLKEYYPLRGLDPQGRPLKEKLQSLGLPDLARILHETS